MILCRLCIPKILFFLTLAFSINCAKAGFSQTVRIQNGLGQWGHGWMFQSSGACFVALPEHVAGPLPKITVSTASPVVSDQATVLKPFWPGIDLAIAVPDQGILDSRCISQLDDLKPSTRTLTAREVSLVRIASNGQETRTRMQVAKRSYLTLEVEVSGDGRAIGQGTSGAFAFVGATPVGMAIESDGVTQAKLIRADEIWIHLKRFLEEQGRAYQPVRSDNPIATGATAQGLPVRSLSSSAAPILPQFGLTNILADGLFVTEAEAPFDIILRLGTESVEQVRRVQVSAEAEGYDVPNRLSLSLSVNDEPVRFRFWTQGRMTPDGVFDTGLIALRNAKWLKIQVLGRWQGNGPIALRSLYIE